jgi:signal transduction histidine kinase
MISPRQLSIRHKLTFIIMATSSVALLLACAAFMLHDLLNFRRLLVTDLSTLSKIIGSNSAAAILFKDPAAARQTLAALKAQEHVRWACIYTREGRLATYVRRGESAALPAVPPQPGYRFHGDHLLLSTPILFDGERVGTVLLDSDLGEIHATLYRYAGIVTLVLAASSLVALALSSRLQRLISEPLLHLVRTARIVSERKDFSVRATRQSDDELGLLMTAFNEMLEQIQGRDAALTGSLDRLEAARKSLVERTAEVERINRELARSNRELEAFAAVASHDLQEPLRKIIAFGDRLAGQCGDALGARERDYLERMQNAAARMQSLIDDLLAYSRVTTRAQPFVPVPLGEVAREVLSDLELRIERTGARVEVGELPTLDADPVQMRQLLQNLLSNALKFHRPDAPPRIRIDARLLDPQAAAPPHCEIRVADDGIGFDEQYLSRLFKPFQRLHGQGAYEGTGIGLAICHKIAERHGGRITAESAPGRGACFVVTLPARQPRGEAA